MTTLTPKGTGVQDYFVRGQNVQLVGTVSLLWRINRIGTMPGTVQRIGYIARIGTSSNQGTIQRVGYVARTGTVPGTLQRVNYVPRIGTTPGTLARVSYVSRLGTMPGTFSRISYVARTGTVPGTIQRVAYTARVGTVGERTFGGTALWNNRHIGVGSTYVGSWQYIAPYYMKTISVLSTLAGSIFLVVGATGTGPTRNTGTLNKTDLGAGTFASLSFTEHYQYIRPIVRTGSVGSGKGSLSVSVLRQS